VAVTPSQQVFGPRIGIIVDGEAEYRSFPELFGKLKENPAVLLSPLKADIQPYASVFQIASCVRSRVAILSGRGAERIVVVLDRETRDECPGEIARALASALQTVCDESATIELRVVVKDRMYENWLIADTDSLTRQRARFSLADGVVRQIRRDKADGLDALEVLKGAVRRGQYEKVVDSIRIMSKADPLAIATNSRSFRRFLRLIDHPSYLSQSKRPIRRRS
jgi:hypothetical protein